MAGRRFWKGFAAGVSAGAGTSLGSWLLVSALRRRHVPIVRVEKSIQIGRPVTTVFDAWSDLEQLPSLLPTVEEVTVRGNRSRWRVRLDGRTFEFDAKITQRIPNQALAWKSLSGPKHTGRINFSTLNSDTEVHVVMNYAPPLGKMGAGIAAQTAVLEGYLAQALREFKAALEKKGQEPAEARSSRPATARGAQRRATGTHGREQDLSGQTQTSRGVPEQEPGS